MAIASCAGNAGGASIPASQFETKPANHKTFYYTGAQQTFKVPAGVKSIVVVARGAAGGISSTTLRAYGRGGRVYAVIPV